MAAIDPRVSSNFSAAKVLAILLVVTGHYFDGSLLWIPVTVGLFVFAYSSANFTALKYADHFSKHTFWSNKIGRLFLPFWIAQSFLLILFLLSGREGIWTWQTLMHWAGQSGWLNWFSVANPSPFGAGLWFITLLLIFYLLYPAIDTWIRPSRRALVSLPIVTLLALVLTYQVNVGHALWLTCLAFWLGVHVARHPIPGSAGAWLMIGFGSALAMLIANLVGLKFLNPVLLAGLSIAAVQWIEKTTVPKFVHFLTDHLNASILEIYLIHTYLFVPLNLPHPVRYIASLVLIIAIASLLARISRRCRLGNARGIA